MEIKEDFVPLALYKIQRLIGDLGNKWQIVRGNLEKEFEFKDFNSALLFVNKVGILAENEKHYPSIVLGYGKVKISIFTYYVNALTVADFILAERINEIF